MNKTKIFIFFTVYLSLILGINTAQSQVQPKVKRTCEGMWNIPVEGQITAKWCYASTTKMILEYYKGVIKLKQVPTQCEIVKRIDGDVDLLSPTFSFTDCTCSSASTQGGIDLKANEMGKWITALKTWGLKNTKTFPKDSISFDLMKRYLDQCIPLVLLVPMAQSLHAIVIAGYVEYRSCNDVLLLIKNPARGCSENENGCEHFMIYNKITKDFNRDRNKAYYIQFEKYFKAQLIVPMI